MIYYVYLLDIDLNSLILKYILMIEKSFKRKLAYTLAKNIGSSEKQYLNRDLYSNRNKKRNSIIHDLNKILTDPRKDTPTFYYKQNKNHVPPWILTNDITFGLAQQWYSILDANQKNEIIEESYISPYDNCTVEVKKKFLSDSLNLLRCFRNKAAHGNRTFNFKHPNKKIERNIYAHTDNKVVDKNEYSRGLGSNDLFSILIIITILLNEPIAKRKWIEELKNFESLLLKQDILDKKGYEVFKLPSNFTERLKFL